MRAFVIIACLVAIVNARPEAGFPPYSGLQQNQLGLPQNAHILKPLVHLQLPDKHMFNNFGTIPQMTYAAPALLSQNSLEVLGTPMVPLEPIQGASQISVQSPIPAAAEARMMVNGIQSIQGIQEDSYNAAYQHSAMTHDSGYANAPDQTTVHKHIYVHVPPKDFEEEDTIQPRIRYQGGPKQKHYKVVFIKAPAPPAIRPPVLPPPPQNEEKTLIYVLHKKPEANQDIVLPTAPPTKPAKPEVYFIKYKTKKEEAPVYGPPAELEPRHAEPSGEYAAPEAEDGGSPMENGDLSAPITTIQPALDETSPPLPQQNQQILNEVPTNDIYGNPTVTTFSNTDEPQPTAPSPSSVSLNSQYIAPVSTQTPIVVEDTHVPASQYGPPNRFYLKKKK